MPRRPERDPETEDDIITCWCGAKGTVDELFDWNCLDDTCNGSGYVNCYCGGDQCVCHHHGQEVECPGCQDCKTDDSDLEFSDD